MQLKLLVKVVSMRNCEVREVESQCASPSPFACFRSDAYQQRRSVTSL